MAPDAPLLTDTAVPPLLLTTAAATGPARSRLGDAAEVVAVGEDVTPAAVLAALAERGLVRVLCEGGPRLFGSFAAAELVDELCLSLAPQLAGAGPGRILDRPAACGDADGPARMRLASVLAHDDGLLLRYRTARGDTAGPPTGGPTSPIG
jgi:riboflavin biosynthesis pyrimidine reductase